VGRNLQPGNREPPTLSGGLQRRGRAAGRHSRVVCIW